MTSLNLAAEYHPLILLLLEGDEVADVVCPCYFYCYDIILRAS